MKRLIVWLGVAVAAASCTTSPVLQTTSTTVPAEPSSTTSSQPTTTSAVPVTGGYLVKLDPTTLEEVPGLEPIPIAINSWNLIQRGASYMVNLAYDANALDRITAIDIETWRVVAVHDVGEAWLEFGHLTEVVIDAGMMYGYHPPSGELVSLDLATGERVVLATWPVRMSFGYGLQMLPGSRIATVGSREDGEPVQAIYVYDPVNGSSELPIKPVDRVNVESGVFYGEEQVAEVDSPGVVWTDSSLLLAYADGPDVVEVDLTTGEITNHDLTTTSWLDRLWAYWFPAASAKGPQLGTYSSASLSDDGNYLFISGNAYEFSESADGVLVEESRPLGAWVVDMRTWEVVARPETPIQYIRESGQGIIGVNRVSVHPWIEEIYLLSDDYEVTVGPLRVEDGGCGLTVEGSHLHCYSWSDLELSVVEVATLETVAGRRIGTEDTLHPNGVLEDWLPRIDS
ncbi:MAG: hypothetical protein L0Z49_13340 [Actinobacteria bacterium]|nr:hypothetical protein [Actinomycetota bacterium]